MSDTFTVTMPKLGESIMSATIIQWFKKPGDSVALDEPLLEVATDKVNSEIPAPVSGIITKLLAEPQEELDVGAPLALISTNGEVKVEEKQAVKETSSTTQEDMTGYFSPAVLRLAREKGIAMDELSRMQGTGSGGRVTKADVENYALKGAPPADGTYEAVPLDGMRKAIADNMTLSHTQIPSATLVTEVDVTGVLETIKKEKEAFLKDHGAKLTITSFIAEAISKAAKQYPLFNASLRGETIYIHKDVNLGIAVSLEKGLMVPVIKGCGNMKLCEIARAVADLGQRARDGKLKPDDVMDGTITMTNFGMGGTLIGIPIIRHPEAAIVGVGAIEERVVQKNGEFVVAKKVYISATFDHRLIDGMDGCAFLQAIKEHLESA